jgi:hypothetical protein
LLRGLRSRMRRCAQPIDEQTGISPLASTQRRFPHGDQQVDLLSGKGN